jgi:hypothetical protein
MKLKFISECRFCGKVVEIEMTYQQFIAWRDRKDLIQNIFPELDADQREFLLSGICPKCWEEKFPSE